MYYAGINIAKKQHEACAIDDEGIQVLAMPIPNTQAGAVRFLTALRKCVGDNTDSVAFCLEVTVHCTPLPFPADQDRCCNQSNSV